MKRILVIQSRQRPEMVEAEQGEYHRAAGDSAELVFVSSLDESMPWNDPERIVAGYQGVILGGSGEFDLHSETADRMSPAREILARLTPLINYLIEHDMPTLGICFGHQLIGEARGGGVTSDEEQAKVGSFEVNLTSGAEGDALFGDLPKVFMGQYGHHNSLTSLPEGAIVLASSPKCKFSALSFGKHIFTTQFHPELTDKDVYWKLEHSPGYLPEEKSLQDVVKPSPEASTIIPKFIENVAK